MHGPGYRIYWLALPSGRFVLVRRADPAALVGRGRLLFPLLSHAIAACDLGQHEPPEPNHAAVDTIRRYCEACLVSPRIPDDITAEEIPFSDALAIYQWATTGGSETDRFAGERAYQVSDFEPLVRGPAALFLDLMCARYHVRPSDALGVGAVTLGFDLDLALAYRGLRRETDAAAQEVEVEDAFGGKHKVPADWLPQSQIPAGAKTIHADTFARRYGQVALSAGGAFGDGAIGPMPEVGQPRNYQ